MALGSATPTLIHQGPGWLYLNVCAPASGKRHVIGADGTPSQPAWPAAQAVTSGQMIVDSNGNIQECTTGGTTFASAPGSWGATLGATTADGSTVVWTCVALAPAYLFAGALEGFRLAGSDARTSSPANLAEISGSAMDKASSRGLYSTVLVRRLGPAGR